jgi:NADH dehydrogenase FAD-containing subunit
MNLRDDINRSPVSSLGGLLAAKYRLLFSISTQPPRTATQFWYTSTVSFRSDEPMVVLVGGGHAHLHSLLHARSFAERGVRVVLVNPSPYLYYSGMATGVISGFYSPEEDRIDVRRLVERGGGRFVQERVVGARPEERTVVLESGESISYDLVSFCLGSEVADGLGNTDGRVIPVKPVENAVEIRARILGYRNPPGPRVLIIGGGAAGCEVAANVAGLMARKGIKGQVTLAEAGPALLGASPKKARRIIRRHLERCGVKVLLECPILSYEDGVAQTGAGEVLEADLVAPAVGIEPRSVFRGSPSSVATGKDGGLWTNHYLQSISDPRIFGGGDAISFRGAALPRLGVFGVRQGPVLFHNLLAALRGEPLKRFTPQRRYLYVLNLGDGTGLAVYDPLVWGGRSAMRLKHAIDRRFIRRYSL